MDAAWDEVVAGALRRALRQDWRLDLQETLFVEVVPHQLHDFMPKGEATVHAGPAQVHVAPFEPRGVVDVDVVADLERGSPGRVEDRQGACDEFDIAGGQFGVFGAVPASHDLARDLYDPFRAEVFCRGVCGLVELRVEDDLRDAGAVAQVDEDERAVVAAAVYPAGQGGGYAGVFRPQVAAHPVSIHAGRPACSRRISSLRRQPELPSSASPGHRE